jgi:hypothetical protein
MSKDYTEIYGHLRGLMDQLGAEQPELNRLPRARRVNAGATRAEIAETIGVAVMVGGGHSVVYGCEALEAAQQFERAPA